MRALVVAAAFAFACEVAPPHESASSAVCEGTPPSGATERVYQALRPQCAGCHAEGVRGYFGSMSAFQTLLVADQRLVKPGDAEGSELVKLLEGRGTGAFRQMPIGGQPYAANDAALPMSEIKAWIAGLGAQVRSVRPDSEAPVITRISGEQIQRSLYQQLGLAHEDFFRGAQNYEVDYADYRDELDYPFQAPDGLPAPREREPAERFFHLGGGSVMTQVEVHRDISPTFLSALTALSQRWCRMAIAKRGNTALFPSGGPSRDANAVKSTMKRWSRRFHGVTLSDAEADELHQTLFVPLDQESGVEPAHVGLCSYFIRHPRWIFY